MVIFLKEVYYAYIASIYLIKNTVKWEYCEMLLQFKIFVYLYFFLFIFKM